METYGADALRLYLINSGLVRAEEQRFADTGVKDMVRRALLPWLNAYKFFNTYAEIDNWTPEESTSTSDNIMDQWILSRLQTLKSQIAQEMELYRLYNVVPALFDFIEDLTNWYIRLNRARFWQEGMPADKQAAYQTLYTAIFELSVSMAPFAPFLAESIYKGLGKPATAPESVHLCSFPEADESLQQSLLETAVERLQHIILLGRQKRNQEKVKTKFPLATLTVIHKDQELLDEIARLDSYIRAELNVKELHYDTNEAEYIDLYAKPNAPVLGKRLGKRFKEFKQSIENLASSEIDQFQELGNLELNGESFTDDDILIFRQAREGTNAVSDRYVSIDLDCNLNDDLIREGLAREVVNRIQKSRKDSGLHVADRIDLKIQASPELTEAIEAHREYIQQETLTTSLTMVDAELTLKFEIDDHSLALEIVKA